MYNNVLFVTILYMAKKTHQTNFISVDKNYNPHLQLEQLLESTMRRPRIVDSWVHGISRLTGLS